MRMQRADQDSGASLVDEHHEIENFILYLVVSINLSSSNVIGLVIASPRCKLHTLSEIHLRTYRTQKSRHNSRDATIHWIKPAPASSWEESPSSSILKNHSANTPPGQAITLLPITASTNRRQTSRLTHRQYFARIKINAISGASVRLSCAATRYCP